MSQLKLTYFDFHGGRGEPARLALHIGGIAFEDNRFAPANFAEVRKTTPLGQVPTLLVDGVQVTQSDAITRYAGKLAGLYPTDPYQALLCDEIIQGVEDANVKMGPTFGMTGDALKQARTALVEGALPLYLRWLQTHDFPAPTPLIAVVWRQLGFVRRTTLVTTAFPGTPAADLLPRLATAERIRVGEAIGSLVGRLHTLGFRDRNLDLRNLLVESTDAGPRVAKIDSPRWRLRAPGRPEDTLAHADWQRLGPQLAAFDLLAVTRAAAARASAH